jgi:Domain of unknown function (DUF5615)
MRPLLDAHVSSRRIGRPLERRGHDVVAIGADPQLAALADEELLAYAAGDRRIVVTHDLQEFPQLLREWAEARRSHAGCLPVTHRTGDYGAILRAIDAAFERTPEQRGWVDRAEFL